MAPNTFFCDMPFWHTSKHNLKTTGHIWSLCILNDYFTIKEIPVWCSIAREIQQESYCTIKNEGIKLTCLNMFVSSTKSIRLQRYKYLSPVLNMFVSSIKCVHLQHETNLLLKQLTDSSLAITLLSQAINAFIHSDNDFVPGNKCIHLYVYSCFSLRINDSVHTDKRVHSK